MIERVVVEMDDADQQALAASVLEKRGCTVTETSDRNPAVLVPDSQEAEEGVTEALNDAGWPAWSARRWRKTLNGLRPQMQVPATATTLWTYGLLRILALGRTTNMIK